MEAGIHMPLKPGTLTGLPPSDSTLVFGDVPAGREPASLLALSKGSTFLPKLPAPCLGRSSEEAGASSPEPLAVDGAGGGAPEGGAPKLGSC